MISGRQTLATIQAAISEEQQRSSALEQRLAEVSQRLARLDVGRGEALEALARLRLEHLEQGGPAARIADADARVLAMLERRQAQIEALEAVLQGLEQETVEQHAEREEKADALEQASIELDEAEAATQARLDGDPGYRAARDHAEATARVAQHATDKAEQSEHERAVKERAYHDDPLFMYLWRRGYATRDYRASGLVRWLDGKVARHVGFDGARANYARLQELPVRLREHADAVQATADEAHAALAALDRAARQEDGVVALEAARERAAESLAAVDARLEALARERSAGHERLELVARGEDDAYRKALAFLASEFGRGDLQQLRQQALMTPFPEDDAIVARLLDLEQERSGTEATLGELKAVAARNRERLRELEQLRIDFTRERMDQPGSSFADATMVATVVAQFLQGAMTRDALWRVLQQQRRQAPQRSNPTFGSGGFGRGSPWTGGGTIPRPTTPRLPRSGGSIAGGGFRTGGRIGGGGFRTGGKF